jgi:hypothetical protein
VLEGWRNVAKRLDTESMHNNSICVCFITKSGEMREVSN